MKHLILGLASVLLFGGLGIARAATIFDNFHPSPFINGIDGQADAGIGFAAFISQVTATTTITNISVETQLLAYPVKPFGLAGPFDGTTGALTFFVYDLTANSGFSTGPKVFTDQSFAYHQSDDFKFTLLAGHQYDIGYTANKPSNVGGDNTGYTQNGITSGPALVELANKDEPGVIQGFSSPQILAKIDGLYDIHIRLGFDPSVTGPELTQFLPAPAQSPEPATFTIFAIGIAAMAGYSWRRRKGLRC